VKYVFLFTLFCSVIKPHIIRAESTLPVYSEIQSLKRNKTSFELINFNPSINRWFLLKINDGSENFYHIENVDAENRLKLTGRGLEIKNMKNGHFEECHLWGGGFDLRNAVLDKYRNPYFPLCEGLLYLRLKRDSTTALSLTEWATEKLRLVKFGEKFINFVKPVIVSAHAETAKNRRIENLKYRRNLEEDLLSAKVNEDSRYSYVSVGNHLGISVDNEESYMEYGKWYKSRMHPNIFISLITPGFLHYNFMGTDSGIKYPVKEEEMDKLIYLVAYDLSEYSINVVHGTEYPGIPSEGGEEGSAGLLEDLAMAGTVPPYMINRTVGVFIGGYKRSHGYFKYGEHHGKYYGYIENGVALSKMEPGLATIYTTKDEEIQIGKWPEDPDREKELLKTVVSARQNGVLIVDDYIPGKHINSWGHGNWSGDADGNLRTLRSAVCIQNNGRQRNLIFAAFTSTTPGTMARVLRAYSCETAMQLDMNAYIYLHNAIFKFDENNKIDIEYLHSEMEYPKGLKYHRYILDNNNRDFFYVFKRKKNLALH